MRQADIKLLSHILHGDLGIPDMHVPDDIGALHRGKADSLHPGQEELVMKVSFCFKVIVSYLAEQ